MPRDLDSLEAVFDRHFDDVYGYVAYRLAPDRQAAEDVTQEVFLAAIENWSSYRGDGAVLSWLRGIARNLVADRLKLRYGTDRRTEQCDLSQLAAAGSHVAPYINALAEVMASLPAEMVELLEEKYLEGLSVRQMAERHARTEKAIESALSRARASMRDAFLRLEARQEDRDEHT
jgi:RNA polymerase sigma-70 factor (ECF subfamily)